MAEKDVKKALGASLKAEAQRVEERFAQAAAKSRDERADKPDKEKMAASAKPGKERSGRTRVTLPQDEYARVGELKQRCRQAGFSVKKGELLGVGLRLLIRLEPARIADLLEGAARAAKKAKGGKSSKADTRKNKRAKGEPS